MLMHAACPCARFIRALAALLLNAAPTLHAEPGKSFSVKIRNKISRKLSKLLGPPSPNRTDYVREANPTDGPYSAAKPYGFQFVGEQPDGE